MFGNVKWFNNEKGYGFIDYAQDEDIFVHYSAIKQEGYKTLTEGQRVEFDLIETPKGLQAINVRPASSEKVMQFVGNFERCRLFDLYNFSELGKSTQFYLN